MVSTVIECIMYQCNRASWYNTSAECSIIIILLLSELRFRFEPAAYSVSEGSGSVALGIVFSGDAGEFVPHVITSTTDGTATGNNNEIFDVKSILHNVTCTRVSCYRQW